MKNGFYQRCELYPQIGDEEHRSQMNADWDVGSKGLIILARDEGMRAVRSGESTVRAW